MSKYAYAICDEDGLAVLDRRVHVYWYKSIALEECPEGFTVKRIRIELPKSKDDNT